MTAAGWNPDPTGRHELRYWDGNAWTDHVSDGGVSTTDPVAGATATPVQPVQPSQPVQAPQAGPPTRTAPAGPPMAGVAADAPTARSTKPLMIVGGVLVVVAIAAVAFLLLGGDDGGRDVAAARTGLQNLLDDSDAPDEFTDDAVDIGDCPFDFLGLVSTPITDADSDASDIDPDTNLVVVFLPPDEQTLTCGVFADDSGDGFFVDVYITSMGEGQTAQDLVQEYNDLSDDTGVDIELTDLGKAAGGEMFQACADQFVPPGEDPEDFFEDPYCDTVWVSDGLVIGLEQFGSQSLVDEDAKSIVLGLLDEILATLEAEA